MKKVLFMLAFAGLAIAANAQSKFVLGGQLDFSTNNQYTNHFINGPIDVTEKGDTYNQLRIAPKFGYNLNDKMQVGVALGVMLSNSTDYDYSTWSGIAAVSGKDYYNATRDLEFFFAPYFRYNVAQLGKFTLFCEAQLTFAFGAKTKYHDFEPEFDIAWNYLRDIDTTYTTDWGYKSMSIDLTVVPGLNYKFNEKCSMDLYIDLVSLGVSYNKLTTGEYTDAANVKHLDENSYVDFHIGANANAQTINNHLGNFRIGFNYHF